MNKTETGDKLDFQNVLIIPKRSTLYSRSQITLDRKFSFKHSEHECEGVPIIAANMDTTGTFEVYNTLKPHKIITALHKFYTLTDFQINQGILDPDFFMVSTGITDSDFSNLSQI
jgi:GMP reductase